jgi:hypothetical protein
MLKLIHEGGFPMFFIMGFGFVALATAFVFAARPTAAHERFISWMALATLGAVLCGTCADLATVFHVVARKPLDADERTRILLVGLGESMAPGVLGFAILSLVALMLAVGKRRLDAKRGA